MARSNRFARDFRNLHGAEAEVYVRANGAPTRQMPLAHWPFWLRAVVLAPLIIALTGFAGLLLFVGVTFAWMMGTALLGPFWGGCVGVVAGLVAVSALLVGLFGRK